jgi:predicted flavoprotein YhiN
MLLSRLTVCVSSSNMQGQFKDEFVTAGGVPLSEVLNRQLNYNFREHESTWV